MGLKVKIQEFQKQPEVLLTRKKYEKVYRGERKMKKAKPGSGEITVLSI